MPIGGVRAAEPLVHAAAGAKRDSRARRRDSIFERRQKAQSKADSDAERAEGDKKKTNMYFAFVRRGGVRARRGAPQGPQARLPAGAAGYGAVTDPW